ncbi:MAG: bis(5'-nucleosyl)-tetraphosphatase (symmetrical) YqeK [Endomicrobium sp.]|jgi:predicted HD superfamily hydrolase involved in NAD metabolism|nr:bis(5'-nucleosyl)-tetraphosphatase (symmetrical) YqeK [Endomicrobium sp.]
MKNLEKKIFEYLSGNLTPERFEHSYYVSKFAVELASIKKANVLKIQTAALLHDCAKSMNDKELVKFLKQRGKEIKYFKEMAKYSPQLLHSFAGEQIIKDRIKIKDKEILNAVKYHTLGRPSMSIAEKILFVSDAVSYDRKYKGVDELRSLAKMDIDAAFMRVLSNKIKYVIGCGKWLCPQTIETWNYYAQKD